jgi:hypothetical protein
MLVGGLSMTSALLMLLLLLLKLRVMDSAAMSNFAMCTFFTHAK